MDLPRRPRLTTAGLAVSAAGLALFAAPGGHYIAATIVFMGALLILRGTHPRLFYRLLRWSDPLIVIGEIDDDAAYLHVTNQEATDSFSARMIHLEPRLTSPGFTLRWRGSSGTETMTIPRGATRTIGLCDWELGNRGILLRVYASTGFYGGSQRGRGFVAGQDADNNCSCLVSLKYRVEITSHHGYRNEKEIRIRVCVEGPQRPYANMLVRDMSNEQ